MTKSKRSGKVYLVGAGPGDPGLLTLKGKECLEAADVVLYDYLANPVLLQYAPATAQRIYVGRRGRGRYQDQADINRLLIERAKEGNVVVRLKGGDPFVFGRGGEEAEAVAAAGVDFELVPGVTAAVAVPAYAGIPVTHRTLASTVTFVTGHEDPTKPSCIVGMAQVSQYFRDSRVHDGHEESSFDRQTVAVGGTAVRYSRLRRSVGGARPSNRPSWGHWAILSQKRKLRISNLRR